MIKNLSGDENTLTKWIGAVDADLPALRVFTSGLARDLAAVVAGLTLPYNSAAVEGTVNRIKQLKAAMYGRAKPDLLRKLILLAHTSFDLNQLRSATSQPTQWKGASRKASVLVSPARTPSSAMG